jgi:hypothetical protein
MKTYKIIIMMFIFLFGLSFSCSRENGETTYEEFKIINFETSLYGKKEGIDELNKLRLDSLDTIKYDSLFIELIGEIEQMTVNNRNKGGIFVYKAYADNIKRVIAGNIDSLNIYSDTKYNNQYPPGENLNDIFQLKYQKDDGLLIEEKIYVNDFLKSNPSCKKNYILYITKPPVTTSTHIFNIHYWETDETFIEVQTIPITITP